MQILDNTDHISADSSSFKLCYHAIFHDPVEETSPCKFINNKVYFELILICFLYLDDVWMIQFGKKFQFPKNKSSSIWVFGVLFPFCKFIFSIYFTCHLFPGKFIFTSSDFKEITMAVEFLLEGVSLMKVTV